MDKFDLKCVITQVVLTLVVFYVAVLATSPPAAPGMPADLIKPKMLAHDAMLYVLFAGSIIVGNVLSAMLNNGCPQKSSLF